MGGKGVLDGFQKDQLELYMCVHSFLDMRSLNDEYLTGVFIVKVKKGSGRQEGGARGQGVFERRYIETPYRQVLLT